MLASINRGPFIFLRAHVYYSNKQKWKFSSRKAKTEWETWWVGNIVHARMFVSTFDKKKVMKWRHCRATVLKLVGIKCRRFCVEEGVRSTAN